MTSTPVSNVKSFFMNFAANASNSVSDGSPNFTDVLNKQTGNGAEDVNQDKNSIRTESKVNVRNTKNLKEKSELSKTDTNTDATEVNPEQKLEEAAKDAVAAIAEEMNVSEEEVLKALENLGLTPMDLLQTDNLAMVVMEVAGETDPLAMVTNEGLYTAVQNLTEEIQTNLNQIQKDLGITDGAFGQLVEQITADMKQSKQTSLSEEQPEGTTVPVTLVEEPNAKETVATNVVEKPVEENTQTGETQAEETVEDGEKAELPTQTHQEDTKGQDNARHGDNRYVIENPMLQQANLNRMPETAFVDKFAESFTQDTKQIMDQIMEFMKIQVKPEMSQLEMQLHPESLGTLNVQISSKEGMVTAHFTTQNEEVKAALESQMIQLKDNFNEQGVKVEAIEVSVQSNAFKKEYEQNREQGNEQEQESKKRTTRRINLDNPDFTEEELSKEDVLTTQMMEANGNTVDYTA